VKSKRKNKLNSDSSPLPTLKRAPMDEYGNVLNIALVCRGDDDDFFSVAAWLPSHDAVLRELLSSPDLRLRPGKRYSTNGKQGSVHFVADDGGRVFCAITKVGYPSRVAHMCLDDFQDKVLLSPHNSASLIASQPHELSKPMQNILDGLVDKYDNPSECDAMTSVQSKIDVTTSTMQENIGLLLENDAKLEQIEIKADNMTDQSAKFRASSKNLKDKMWWKLCKMRICYALIALSLLAIIIVPMSLQANAAATAVDSSSGSSTTTVVHVHGDDEYWQQTHNNAGSNSFRSDDGYVAAPEQKAVATEQRKEGDGLEQLFSSFDMDASGSLSVLELQKAITSSSPEEAVQLEALLVDNQESMLNDGVDFESFVSSFVDDSTSLGLLSTREQHASALSIPEEQKRVVDEVETVQGPREAGKAQKQDFKPSLATIKEDAEGDIAR
jgi:hypothetical protein